MTKGLLWKGVENLGLCAMLSWAVASFYQLQDFNKSQSQVRTSVLLQGQKGGRWQPVGQLMSEQSKHTHTGQGPCRDWEAEF